jgi:hypothetical protein
MQAGSSGSNVLLQPLPALRPHQYYVAVPPPPLLLRFLKRLPLPSPVLLIFPRWTRHPCHDISLLTPFPISILRVCFHCKTLLLHVDRTVRRRSLAVRQLKRFTFSTFTPLDVTYRSLHPDSNTRWRLLSCNHHSSHQLRQYLKSTEETSLGCKQYGEMRASCATTSYLFCMVWLCSQSLGSRWNQAFWQHSWPLVSKKQARCTRQ